MTPESMHDGIRVFSIAAPDGAAHADVVPDLGGIVSSLRLGDDRERLFRHDGFWDPSFRETRGGIPLLFPICGRLLVDGTPGLYRVGDRTYRLPIHGFAMRRPWEVADASRPDALRLRLVDSEETRASYPFAFELELFYSVSLEGLRCRLAVRNTGAVPLPYYAGFHPYFLAPPPGGGKEQTVFGARPRTRHVYDETKTDVIGSAPPPAFPMSIADESVNGLLLEMGADNETRIRFPDGSGIRQTASPLFRYRQFYTLPDQPFFCDEPWMAPPGSLNRPGAARILPPGQAESAEVRIAATLDPPAPRASGSPPGACA